MSEQKGNGLEVAFQGEDGSYAQEVAFTFFGKSVNTRQCDTLEEVFRLVQDGRASHGIVPVENSQEGSMGRTYDLLLESDVMVCGEMHVRMTYSLVANKSATLGSIKKIYSHPHALAQCQAFLRHLGCELIPTYNTTAVVKMIKDKKAHDIAVITSESVAFAYDMQILAREVEDNPRNSTRFFVLSKTDSEPTGEDRTSIVILLKHKPGTVYAAVKEFADHEINLTKVEARPTRKTPWEYNFYLDFEGHRNDRIVSGVLDHLRNETEFLKVLGSYPRAKT